MRITDWFDKSLREMLAANPDWNLVYEAMNGMAVILGPDGHAVSVWYDNNGNIIKAHDGSEMMYHNCYSYINSDKVYGRDNSVYRSRGFGKITSDRVLMEFAKKVTGDWYSAGWHRDFEDYYLSDYALDHPYCDLTESEFKRLRELQKEARDKAEAADKAREWKYVRTICYADNSEEEIWVDKDGVEKTVMTVGPHGDLC